MGYIGNDESFAYTDNFCENFLGGAVAAEAAVNLGGKLGGMFSRICIGYSCSEDYRAVSALISGMSGQSCEIFMLGEVAPTPFRYSLTLLDCAGVYVSSKSKKILFYGANGFGLTETEMIAVMNFASAEPTYKSQISHISGFDRVYLRFIEKSGDNSDKLSASVSCGNKAVRNLWLSCFDGENDRIVFQVSDDGEKVNAYILGMGFVSYERLVLAYSVMLGRTSEEVYLPERYHYSAEETAEKYGFKIRRFNPADGVPEKASEQIFLKDSLYMCRSLMQDYSDFIDILSDMPKFSSARIEIPLPENNFPDKSVYPQRTGRVFLERSGRSTLSVLAQAMDSETAAELCSSFEAQLHKRGYCSGIR